MSESLFPFNELAVYIGESFSFLYFSLSLFLLLSFSSSSLSFFLSLSSLSLFLSFFLSLSLALFLSFSLFFLCLSKYYKL